MKVSGFTIVKNAVRLEYPFVESIRSILPIVDEYVVLVGKSEDDTAAKVEAIGSPKVRIVENEWKDTVRKDGCIFSMLTNLALAECAGEWAFYLQADEVLHEKDLPELQRLMRENLERKAVKAISLRFRHFHGDYRTVNPYAHRKATRIVRNNGEVVSVGDAVAFALRDDPEQRSILDGPKENIVRSNVFVFHYSWVKDRRKLVEKSNLMMNHYFGEEAKLSSEYHIDLTVMKRFRGTHPQVMEKRIAEFQSPLPPHRSRWLNPAFWAFLLKHGYKG